MENKKDLEQLNKDIESINNYIKTLNEKDDEERSEAYKNLGKLSEAFIRSIDSKEQTEWEKEKRSISKNIREALIDQLIQYRRNYVYTDKKTGELQFYEVCNFLDYCNCVKALLAIYNFGSIGDISEQDVKSDLDLIKEGIVTILSYIGDENRYDISSETMLTGEDCRQILVDSEGNNIPVTVSLAAVMTTLVYLRRAMNRNGRFTKESLNRDVKVVFYDKYNKDENGNRIKVTLYEKVVETMSEIMAMLYGYVSQSENRYQGWGFTIKSKKITLNDTYAVVDAISRFLDAFMKDEKRDKEFTEDIDAKFKQNVNHYSVYGYFKDTNISEKILDAMYNVAFVTYQNTQNVYGQGIFYAEGQEYFETTYDQISNSNRSSALFNPLYAAMITMYGYNEKEVVIRKFMDDVNLMSRYYKKYETSIDEEEAISAKSSKENKKEDRKEEDKEQDNEEEKNKTVTLSDFASEVDWFNDEEFGKDFNEAIKKLYFSDEAEQAGKSKARSTDYNSEWRRYYSVARVFQKYIEKNHPEELLEIPVYRDYMNATRDTISQVQIMYRKFNDSQKLGIVDTDYVMFSRHDIDVEPSTLSKLNKANIAVNSLRPILLSAKILIVAALIKYPQNDMEELYNAIKASKYSKRKRDKKSVSTEVKWLWDEDRVNMNSTARHCEAIMYDYFDYYEKYELGFRAISKIQKDVSAIASGSANSETGALNEYKDGGNPFVNLVMEMTQNNLGAIQNVFNAGKEQLEKTYEKDLVDKTSDYEKLLKAKDEDIRKLEAEKKRQQSDIFIGETLKEWIREEAESYLKETLSYIILHKLNFKHDKLEDILCGCKRPLYSGEFENVKELALNLKKGLTENDTQVVEKTKAKIKELEDRAQTMTELFEGAFDGIIDTKDIYDETDKEATELGDSFISRKYKNIKENRKSEKSNISNINNKKSDEEDK